MGVIIHGPTYASATRRVMLCLVEKEIEFEIVHVDLLKEENKPPEYLKLQPFGLVPVIQDGDLTLFETRAIMRYTPRNMRDKAQTCWGRLQKRAIVDQWLEVEGHNYHPPIYILIWELIFNMEAVKESEENMAKVFDVYDERLSMSKYLAGDFFAWWDDITTRPAWKKVLDM